MTRAQVEDQQRLVEEIIREIASYSSDAEHRAELMADFQKQETEIVTREWPGILFIWDEGVHFVSLEDSALPLERVTTKLRQVMAILEVSEKTGMAYLVEVEPYQLFPVEMGDLVQITRDYFANKAA